MRFATSNRTAARKAFCLIEEISQMSTTQKLEHWQHILVESLLVTQQITRFEQQSQTQESTVVLTSTKTKNTDDHKRKNERMSETAREKKLTKLLTKLPAIIAQKIGRPLILPFKPIEDYKHCPDSQQRSKKEKQSFLSIYIFLRNPQSRITIKISINLSPRRPNNIETPENLALTKNDKLKVPKLHTYNNKHQLFYLITVHTLSTAPACLTACLVQPSTERETETKSLKKTRRSYAKKNKP